MPVLDVVSVTANNEKDWEMLVSECRYTNELDLTRKCTEIECKMFFFFVCTNEMLGSDELSNTEYAFGSNENCERGSEAHHLDQQGDEHIR